ncbi:MAG: hypothetical protein WD397_12335 [Wenzhouxiangellaceae bacterium]
MKKHDEGKNRFIRINTAILALLFALSGGFLAGCDNNGPAEEAGENIDEAVEDAGDAIEDAGDDIDDETDG